MMKKASNAALVERKRLTKPHSSKSTWHLAFEVQDDSFTYTAGDSMAVLAENDPIDVENVCRFFEVQSGQMFGEKGPVEEFLLRKVDLTKVPLKLVRAVEGSLEPQMLEKLQAFVEKHTFRGSLLLPVSAFLRTFGIKDVSLESFLNGLQPLLPRLYSIASSPRTDFKKVELVVAEVTHTVSGEERRGLCSHFLSRRAPLFKPTIKVAVHEAKHFRLPCDSKAPLIMIGPGTGVAPFRAFLHDLELARDVMPPCWLFFGDRNRESDFLYEDFFLRHEKQGTLHLDLAFSRDSEEKVYVQHRMWEQRVKVASWIAGQGAHVYVCGDAQGMAKEVEEVLQKILIDQNVVSSQEEANTYLAHMRQVGRYCKDVY